MQNKCLPVQFFANLDNLYENCYRINPRPERDFIDRMHLIEITARGLYDDLLEIQANSYRNWEHKRLTNEERSTLEEYDRSKKILDSFLPYLTAAFFLTSPGFTRSSDISMNLTDEEAK